MNEEEEEWEFVEEVEPDYEELWRRMRDYALADIRNELSKESNKRGN